MTRVVLIHWSLPPTVGGVETHLVDLACSLISAGARVTLISGEEYPDQSLFPGEVEFLYEPLLALARLRSSQQSAKGTFSAFQDRLIERDPDVIHAHNIFPLGSLELARSLERIQDWTGAGLVHTSYSEWDPQRGILNTEKWNLLSVSRFLARRLLLLQGWTTAVLHLPVDSQRFYATRDTLRTESVKLLHPCRLVQEKGVQLSIELLSQLVKSGVDALLTLTQPSSIFEVDTRHTQFRQHLAQSIDLRGINSRISFVAPSLREMPTVYEASDIVLYPSLFEEPYGLVPLEAMSCRRPVIASDIGGMTETIRDGETGLLVPVGDVARMVDAVEKIIRDPDYARTMGDTGREQVMEHHALKPFCRDLLRVYEQRKDRH